VTETFEQWWANHREHNETTRDGYARWAADQPPSRELEIGRALFGPCIAWDRQRRVWGAVAPGHRAPTEFVRAASAAADQWDAEHPEAGASLPTREMIYVGELWLREQLDGRQLGISARSLVRHALTGHAAKMMSDQFPQDPGDLARCEQVFTDAPEWAKERMLPLLEEFRRHVTSVRASGRAWWR
jgi:hypothetical protein